MRIRTLLTVTAVPALVVALAAPGHAVSRGTVAFGGRITIQPMAVPQQLDLCFFATAECLNGAPSTGVAAGVGTEVTDPAIDGLQARATYVETCVAGVPVVGSAELTGKLHKPLTGAWSGDVSANWTRAGLVAVITGEAVGTALFTPESVPVCGQPVSVVVAGAFEVAY